MQSIIMKGIHITLISIIALGIILTLSFIAFFSKNSDHALLEGVHITVHKTPTCGCCGDYVGYLEKQGATVRITEHQNLTEERSARNIPTSLESCHFSEVEGYVVEGHVPAEAIVQLIAERPEISGIALPGMPAGSPGMGGTKLSPFTIHQFRESGYDEGVYMTI